MKKSIYILLSFSLLLAACAAGVSEVDSQEITTTSISLIPYTSRTLGINSLVPSGWAQFFPVGTFVRAMPQSDPTFLIFGAIPGVTSDQMIASIMDQTNLQEKPTSAGSRKTEVFNWALYSFEIQQGFLLTYKPDYGTLALDVALAESDGKVFAVAIGASVNERNTLYESVFLPAVDAFAIYNGIEAAPLEIDLPERDYWPTDKWRIAPPEEQGMNSDKLREMVEYIDENNISIKNVLIVRHGYIVLEETFKGFQSRDNLQSATKSFTSALVGIAIDKGYIEGVDQTVLSLFPDREITNLDDRKQAMTVEDLLTMESGLDWPPGPCWWLEGAECADYTTQIMLEDDDSLPFILNQPMVEEPGKIFNYIAGASHLLSAMISETTGLSALDFAQKNLFRPLGIEGVTWSTDGEGLNLGYSDIAMLPQDMAKFGFLYLNEGLWDGEQVISAEWVRASQQPHAVTTNKIQPNYGYQWWVNPELGFYNAAGNGGNYIIVVPEHDMVVVFTGNLTSRLGQNQWWEGTPEELFRVYILSSVDD